MPEQESTTPEQENANKIDIYAIALKTLNIGLSRAKMKDLELDIRKGAAANMEEEIKKKGLTTEAEIEDAAREIVEGYIKGAKPEEDVEQPAHEEKTSSGNLEKVVKEGDGKKVPLADMPPKGLDLHEITRRAINYKLGEEEGLYQEISPNDRAKLTLDLVKFLETHAFETREKAEELVKREVKFMLEPYRNKGTPVEQPIHEEQTSSGNLEKAVEYKRGYKTAGVGMTMVALGCIFFGGIGVGVGSMGIYQTLKAKEKPKPVISNSQENPLEKIILREKKEIKEINTHLAAMIRQMEEKGRLEQLRDNFYQLLEMKKSGKISSFDETPFQEIISTEPEWRLRQAGYLDSQKTQQVQVPEDKGLREITKKIDNQTSEITRLIQTIKQGYSDIARTGMENYLALSKEIREIGKTDPEPLLTQETPAPTPEDLLSEVEGEKPVTPATPNPYSFAITPYAGMKFALNAEDKPDPMPVYGLELEVGKDDSNFSVYLAGEYGTMDSSETSSAGSLDLKSTATSFRLGGKLSTSKERKLIGSIGAGARVTLERNEITGRVGTYDIDDSRDETIFGVEATAGLEFKLTDNISLTAGATYSYNFKDDNSNVTDDLTGKVGVTVKF